MPASKAASPTLAWGVSKRIKCHIELEDIDPLLAEDAEKPVLGHLGDKGAELVATGCAPWLSAAPGTRQRPA